MGARRTPTRLRAALGATAPNSPSSRPRSTPGSARSRPRRCRRARSGCACSTTSARFLQSLAADARPAAVRRRPALGGPGHAGAAPLPAAPPAQRARADPRAYREIELDRAHPLAARWSNGTASGSPRASRWAACRREDTGALLATLFGQASVSDEFAAAIHRETEGNPFFIEEVVKSLIEQGADLPRRRRWGRKETHELGDPAEREGSDRPAARPADRADRGRAAHRGGARQGVRRSPSWPRSPRRRGRAARRAGRGERGAARPRNGRGRGAGATTVRLHARQDPRGAVRGVESDPPPPPAPAHRRSAGERGRPQRRRRGDARAAELAYHFAHGGDFAKLLDYSRRAPPMPNVSSPTRKRSGTWSRHGKRPKGSIAATTWSRSTRSSATSMNSRD